MSVARSVDDRFGEISEMLFTLPLFEYIHISVYMGLLGLDFLCTNTQPNTIFVWMMSRSVSLDPGLRSRSRDTRVRPRVGGKSRGGDTDSLRSAGREPWLRASADLL